MIKALSLKKKSLKVGLLRAIIVGIVLAVLVYVSRAFVSEHPDYKWTYRGVEYQTNSYSE